MTTQTAEAVKNYYNAHIHEEDRRLDLHVFELPVTLGFIKRYLPRGSKILDISCGTGRYAEALINEGYILGLNDISEKAVQLTRKRVGASGNVLFIEHSDALDSDIWQREAWEAVLILGPLYHFIEKQKRIDILRKASVSILPDGFVFSAFMSRIGAMVYGLKNNPQGIHDEEGAYKLWQTGTDSNFVEGTESFTHTYFELPQDIAPLIENAGLKQLHLAGIEGIFGERFELYHQMDNETQNAWMDFIIRNCEDANMVCNSKHLLSVSRRSDE